MNVCPYFLKKYLVLSCDFEFDFMLNVTLNVKIWDAGTIKLKNNIRFCFKETYKFNVSTKFDFILPIKTRWFPIYAVYC